MAAPKFPSSAWLMKEQKDELIFVRNDAGIIPHTS